MNKVKSLASQLVVRRKTVEQDTEKTVYTGPWLGTGSTMINLAISNRARGGIMKGKIVNWVGDSGAGKTVEGLTMMAEAAYNPDFDGYRLIYDDPETAIEFDVRRLFGQRLLDRMEAPAYDKDGDPLPSDTVEQFQHNILRALKAGKPFVYVLDSLDSITTEEEIEIMEHNFKVREEETGKEKASYADARKAAALSQFFRKLRRQIEASGSILVIISQVRTNMDPYSPVKKTRAGGKALEFYSTLVVWLTKTGRLKKTVNRMEFSVGGTTEFKVTKNQQTGRYVEGSFNIYPDYGIDDIGSIVDFLIESGAWKKEDGLYHGPGVSAGTAKELADKIAEAGAIATAADIAESRWCRILGDLRVIRPSRYADSG